MQTTPPPSLSPPALEATFSLTLPESVSAPQADSTRGVVTLTAEQLAHSRTRAKAVVEALLQPNDDRDAFQQRLDEAFSLGRHEIAHATSLANAFTEQNFALEPTSPVFNAMTQLRETFEGLNPANQRNLTQTSHLFGLKLPFINPLKSYLRRYESAQTHIDAIVRHLALTQTEVGISIQELNQTQGLLLNAMQSLEQAHAVLSATDSLLEEEIEALKTADPLRASTLEHEVLYYVRQNLADIIASQALTINAYLVAGELRKTGREVMIGCDRVKTLGMAALTVAVTLARATGIQVKTMEMLQGTQQTIEGLIASTGSALERHVAETTRFASNPSVGVEALEVMFARTLSAMGEMERFRAESLQVTADNNNRLRAHIHKLTSRIATQEADRTLPVPIRGDEDDSNGGV